jgi:hypothetical protein
VGARSVPRAIHDSIRGHFATNSQACAQSEGRLIDNLTPILASTVRCDGALHEPVSSEQIILMEDGLRALWVWS